jgi:polysaccharide biosynthesis protein VpsM
MRTTKLWAAGVACAIVTGAHAQSMRPSYSFPKLPEGSGPAAIQLGGSPFYFSPRIGLAAGRDDNVLNAPSGKTSSTVYLANPGFKLDARSERTVFQSGYEARIGRYSSSKDDNYVDHAAHTRYDVAFDRRNFLRLGVDYTRGHDPRGLTDRPIGAEPDRFRLLVPAVTYAFGAPGAAGRFETYASELRKRYQNNRATTALGDRDSTEFGATRT